MYDLIIKNGSVISTENTVKQDIGVKDGKIQYVGKLNDDVEAKRIINAEGKYVIPGVIDAHMDVLAPFQG